jgi:hypothetical protein
MQARVLERISTYTAFGLRFWDPAFGMHVQDGMTATARPWGRPMARPVAAVATYSGALAFHGLPGLRALESGGPDAPVASPATRRFLIEVADSKRRYAPAAFPVDLPLPYAGPYLGPVLPSPAPPGFLLLSGPDRPAGSTLAAVKGSLALAATGAPAAWALITVTDHEGALWHGIAGADGRFAVVLPWPALDEVAPGSPSTGAASPLSQRSWPIGVTVQAAPAGLAPITASGLPDYAEVLTQPAAGIWPAPPADPPAPSPVAAPVPVLSVSLAFGATLVLRSGTDNRLLVGAAPNPP